MVDKREKQASVIMHCYQCQRPRVVVVDELESESDAMAAIHCRRRGVRLIAGMTGSLSSLMDDANFSSLVGGLSMSEAGTRPTTQPVFDAIVELKWGALNEWRVITDTTAAVDSILNNHNYHAQLRIRDPETGSIQIESERVYIG